MTLVYIFLICNFVITMVALFFAMRLAMTYHTFNQNVKNWANSLDKSCNAALQREAMRILSELDSRISQTQNPVNHEKMD